jgi:hypothetical protein
MLRNAAAGHACYGQCRLALDRMGVTVDQLVAQANTPEGTLLLKRHILDVPPFTTTAFRPGVVPSLAPGLDVTVSTLCVAVSVPA